MEKVKTMQTFYGQGGEEVGGVIFSTKGKRYLICSMRLTTPLTNLLYRCLQQVEATDLEASY